MYERLAALGQLSPPPMGHDLPPPQDQSFARTAYPGAPGSPPAAPNQFEGGPPAGPSGPPQFEAPHSGSHSREPENRDDAGALQNLASQALGKEREERGRENGSNPQSDDADENEEDDPREAKSGADREEFDEYVDRG